MSLKRSRFLCVRAGVLSSLLVVGGAVAARAQDYGYDAVTASAVNGQIAILTQWKAVMPYAMATLVMMIGWKLIRKMIKV